MPEPRPIRWKPAIVVLVASIVALVALWIPDLANRQIQTMATALIAIATTALLLLWFFAFSRAAGRIKLYGLGAIVLCLLIGAGLFRLRGYSGDLVPILEFRWSSARTVVGDVPASAQVETNYARFLGPNRNATLTGVALETDWKANPPGLLWRKPVGDGWSAFAVAGTDAVTQEQHGDLEAVVCYDLFTGEEKWRHTDDARFQNPLGGIGPRATPTIVGGRIFTVGATGILNCLDRETGRVIWSRNAIEDAGGEIPEYGLSGSPLVLSDRVIVYGGAKGKSLLAYTRDTGERLWASGDRAGGYSSPTIASLAGREQILIFNKGDVAGHDPDSGDILWTYPWDRGTQHVANPLLIPGDRIFVSTGYGIGCHLLQVRRSENGAFAAEALWKTRSLKAKLTNVVYRDGYIYGLDDGILVCLDVETGRRAWKAGRYGHGQLILVGDILLIQAESGDVVLAAASPDGHVEHARFPILDRKTWNNPAFAAPYLLVRNDREAVCLQLPLAD